MNLNKLFLTSAFALVAIVNTACSGTSDSIVKGMSLTSAQVNGDVQISVTAELDTGSVTLLPSAFSIVNPKKTSQVLGQMSVLSSIDGSGSWELQLTLDVNQALAASSKPAAVTLPNGTTIPISAINASNWVSLPVGLANSNLYLNVDLPNKKAVVGIAMSVEAISAGVSGDAFLPFLAGSVSGLAGVYTSATPGLSGIGTFIDLSSVLSSTGLFADFSTPEFVGSYRNGDIIQRHLADLQRKGARVRLH